MSAESTPVMFVSHGAGPAWLMDASGKQNSFFGEIDRNSKSADFMRNMQTRARLPRKPRAILVVSAHWEEREHTVTTASKPSLFFDYYGFPDETYKVEYPVPGAPEVAERTKSLLKAAGIECKTDSKRGLDHGVFIPLILSYPAADVPVFQLSLKDNLSVPDHLKLGEALQPLTSEGVLILCSGQSTHGGGATKENPDWPARFRSWLHNLMTNPAYTPEERKQKILSGQKDEPSFANAHPRIEHYLPVVVAAAAARYRAGTVEYDEAVNNGAFLMSYIRF